MNLAPLGMASRACFTVGNKRPDAGSIRDTKRDRQGGPESLSAVSKADFFDKAGF